MAYKICMPNYVYTIISSYTGIKYALFNRVNKVCVEKANYCYLDIQYYYYVAHYCIYHLHE